MYWMNLLWDDAKGINKLVVLVLFSIETIEYNYEDIFLKVNIDWYDQLLIYHVHLFLLCKYIVLVTIVSNSL